MFFEKSHKTFTNLVVAVMTAAIVFYSEQALASSHLGAKDMSMHHPFACHG